MCWMGWMCGSLCDRDCRVSGCKPGCMKMGMCDSEYMEIWDIIGSSGTVIVCL